MQRFILIMVTFTTVWFPGIETGFAHDAWLSAKWNAKKTQIIISPVVAETFPNGEPIKDMKRFIDPNVYFSDGRKLPLRGDPKDSSVIGSFPSVPACIVVSGVKQREITYNDTIAHGYLTEEIGLSEDEAAKLITPGVKEFSETYSRHLKTVVATGEAQPKDSTLGLPLEIVLVSWTASKDNEANIGFRLLADGKPIIGATVRILSNGKTTLAKTDSLGDARASINSHQQALLAYIQIKKLSDSRFQSVWTNLAFYRL